MLGEHTRFYGPKELASALPRSGVVLLDGNLGVGKSKLRGVLLDLMECTAVRLDDFFHTDGRASQAAPLSELVDWRSVRGSVAAARDVAEPVLLDSVCGAWAAREIGMLPSAHVLVTITDPRAAQFDALVHSPLVAPGWSLDERALLDDTVSEAVILDQCRHVPLDLLARSVTLPRFRGHAV